VPAEVVEALRQRGHNITVVSDWFTQMGHAHGITLTDGTLRAGADARGDGCALGF
jgi:gamma-glutamyltranspeptidase